jgi:hypothetical protein
MTVAVVVGERLQKMIGNLAERKVCKMVTHHWRGLNL